MNRDNHKIVIRFDSDRKVLIFSYCNGRYDDLNISESDLLKIIDIGISDLKSSNKEKFEKVIGSTILSILNSFANDEINLGSHNEQLISEAYEVIKERAKSGDIKAQEVINKRNDKKE